MSTEEAQIVENAKVSGFFNNAVAWSVFGEDLGYKKIQITIANGELSTWVSQGDFEKIKDKEFAFNADLTKTTDIYGRVGHEYIGEQNLLKNVVVIS